MSLTMDSFNLSEIFTSTETDSCLTSSPCPTWSSQIYYTVSYLLFLVLLLFIGIQTAFNLTSPFDLELPLCRFAIAQILSKLFISPLYS